MEASSNNYSPFFSEILPDFENSQLPRSPDYSAFTTFLDTKTLEKISGKIQKKITQIGEDPRLQLVANKLELIQRIRTKRKIPLLFELEHTISMLGPITKLISNTRTTLVFFYHKKRNWMSLIDNQSSVAPVEPKMLKRKVQEILSYDDMVIVIYVSDFCIEFFKTLKDFYECNPYKIIDSSQIKELFESPYSICRLEEHLIVGLKDGNFFILDLKEMKMIKTMVLEVKSDLRVKSNDGCLVTAGANGSRLMLDVFFKDKGYGRATSINLANPKSPIPSATCIHGTVGYFGDKNGNILVYNLDKNHSICTISLSTKENILHISAYLQGLLVVTASRVFFLEQRENQYVESPDSPLICSTNAIYKISFIEQIEDGLKIGTAEGNVFKFKNILSHSSHIVEESPNIGTILSNSPTQNPLSNLKRKLEELTQTPPHPDEFEHWKTSREMLRQIKRTKLSFIENLSVPFNLKWSFEFQAQALHLIKWEDNFAFLFCKDNQGKFYFGKFSLVDNAHQLVEIQRKVKNVISHDSGIAVLYGDSPEVEIYKTAEDLISGTVAHSFEFKDFLDGVPWIHLTTKNELIVDNAQGTCFTYNLETKEPFEITTVSSKRFSGGYHVKANDQYVVAIFPSNGYVSYAQRGSLEPIYLKRTLSHSTTTITLDGSMAYIGDRIGHLYSCDLTNPEGTFNQLEIPNQQPIRNILVYFQMVFVVTSQEIFYYEKRENGLVLSVCPLKLPKNSTFLTMQHKGNYFFVTTKEGTVVGFAPEFNKD